MIAVSHSPMSLIHNQDQAAATFPEKKIKKKKKKKKKKQPFAVRSGISEQRQRPPDAEFVAHGWRPFPKWMLDFNMEVSQNGDFSWIVHLFWDPPFMETPNVMEI